MAYEISLDSWPVFLRGRLRIPQTINLNVRNVQNRIATEGRRVSQKLRMSNRLAFQKGGHQEHGGRKWRRLRPNTIVRKGHGTILVNKGRMRRGQSVRGNFRLVGREVRWTVRFINSSPVAHMHQFGFLHHRAGWIAPRPPVWVSKKDAQEVQNIMLSTFMRDGGGGRRRRMGR